MRMVVKFEIRLKQYRRLATRYDKLIVRYLGFVYFTSIRIHPKINVNTTGAVMERTRGHQKATTTARLNLYRVVSPEIPEASPIKIPNEVKIGASMLILRERL